MSMPEKDVFVMYKDRRAKIPSKFSQKDIELLPFIKLHLDLSATFQDTTECLQIMKASHKDALQKMRYSNVDPPTSLRGVIDPLLIRFTEGKRCQLVNGQDPKSLPAIYLEPFYDLRAIKMVLSSSFRNTSQSSRLCSREKINLQ
ncbi:unnamed protein product [Rhizopus stolonifer]